MLNVAASRRLCRHSDGVIDSVSINGWVPEYGVPCCSSSSSSSSSRYHLTYIERFEQPNKSEPIAAIFYFGHQYSLQAQVSHTSVHSG